VPIEVSNAPSGSRHALARGDELTLTLPENPTTGFLWQFTRSGPGELEPIDDRLGAGPGVSAPGASGHRQVRFVARQPGEVTLEAMLRRAWDPPESILERRTYVIVIT